MELTITNGTVDQALRQRVFTLSGGMVTIQGTAPVAPKRVTVRIGDGDPVTVDVAANRTWQATVPASPGRHELHVESTSAGTDPLTEMITVAR